VKSPVESILTGYTYREPLEEKRMEYNLYALVMPLWSRADWTTPICWTTTPAR